MEDESSLRDDLLTDIATLRAIMDAALDEGARRDDILLRACTNLLHERQARLEQLDHP
jgi:hypothetical protein